MGKTKASRKNEIRTQAPLDKQILDSRGGVKKNKSEPKIRLRAEEEGVSIEHYKIIPFVH